MIDIRRLRSTTVGAEQAPPALSTLKCTRACIFLACAHCILTENHEYALLDYFAVIPEKRDCGIGSRFLQNLREKSIIKNGTFIEAESPDTTNTPEEMQLRKRRIQFYHELFGLDVLLNRDGNLILIEGLVLQDERIWKSCLNKDVVPESNCCELYFEEHDLDGNLIEVGALM